MRCHRLKLSVNTRVTHWLLLLSCLLWTTASRAAQDDPKVATVTPIAYSLSAGLLEGTDIETHFLPPQRLPVNRIENWLRKNRSQKFEAFDALVSIGDAVPEYAFSNTLRQTNIRLVTIDIAYARLPEGEKVVLSDRKEYFWLNANNLLLMLGILKRDLALLWPEHRQTINENYQTIAGELRKLSLNIENLLYDADIAVLVFEKKNLWPVAGSLSLDVVTLEEAQVLGLPALHVSSRRSRKEQDSDLPSAPLNWQIDDLSRFDTESLLERLQVNLHSLRESLE